MNKNLPKWFIELLRNWYGKLNSTVRWGNNFSKSFTINSGVRQGGIMSPILFAICVDDLLNNLEKSKRGCYIKSLCYNSFMYADDLVLASLSIRDLEFLVKMCSDELSNIGLMINCNKTFCLRIGNRHMIKPIDIQIYGNAINWVNEIQYLGVTIVSSKRFKLNIQNRKQKFFRAVNAVLGRIGTFSSPDVVLSLIESNCVPVLLYGLECVELNNSLLRSIENAYSQVFSKLFHTFDRSVIKQCQFYMGYLPAELKIANRKMNFLSKISLTNNFTCTLLDVNHNELFCEMCKYKIVVASNLQQLAKCSLGTIDFKSKLFNFFENNIYQR